MELDSKIKKIYVVVSVATPKDRNNNGAGVKVSIAYTNPEKAKNHAKKIRENPDKNVRGIDCEIQTSVIEIDLIED